MRKDAGFSLISVMIALVLLAVGIMTLSRAGFEILASRTNSASRTTALAIARGHMERVRAQPPQNVKAESPVQVDDAGQIDANGPYTRSVLVNDIDATLREVTVRVDYPRATQPVELVTIIYVPVI